MERLGASGKLLMPDKAGATELRSSSQGREARAAGPGLVEGVTEGGMTGVRLMREEG